jgi:hypothetical protein
VQVERGKVVCRHCGRALGRKASVNLIPYLNEEAWLAAKLSGWRFDDDGYWNCMLPECAEK